MAIIWDVLISITPSLISNLGTELLELDGTIILLKLGHQGASLRTAEQTHWADCGRATPVKLADWGGNKIKLQA